MVRQTQSSYWTSLPGTATWQETATKIETALGLKTEHKARQLCERFITERPRSPGTNKTWFATLQVFAIDDRYDGWGGKVTWLSQPPLGRFLAQAGLYRQRGGRVKWFAYDVTGYVREQLADRRVASLGLKLMTPYPARKNAHALGHTTNYSEPHLYLELGSEAIGDVQAKTARGKTIGKRTKNRRAADGWRGEGKEMQKDDFELNLKELIRESYPAKYHAEFKEKVFQDMLERLQAKQSPTPRFRVSIQFRMSDFVDFGNAAAFDVWSVAAHAFNRKPRAAVHRGGVWRRGTARVSLTVASCPR